MYRIYEKYKHSIYVQRGYVVNRFKNKIQMQNVMQTNVAMLMKLFNVINNKFIK